MFFHREYNFHSLVENLYIYGLSLFLIKIAYSNMHICSHIPIMAYLYFFLHVVMIKKFTKIMTLTFFTVVIVITRFILANKEDTEIAFIIWNG